MCVCMYVCMHACMYVCMHVYVCALQSQGFDELLAKLNAALQVLQNSEVQLGTDVTEQVK